VARSSRRNRARAVFDDGALDGEPPIITDDGDAPALRPRGGIVDRIARGSAWTLSTRLVAMFSVFLASALATRVLSQNDAGVYFLATTIVTTAAIIAHFGLPRTVVRLVAEALARDQPGVAKGSIHKVNRLNLAGGALVFAILAFGGGSLLAHHVFHKASTGLELVMVMVAAWSAAEGIRFTASEAFRGLHDIRLASVLGDACRSVLMALGFVVVAIAIGAHHKASLRVAVGVSLAASALTMVLAVGFLGARTRRIRVRARSVSTAMVIAIALPLTLTDLTGMIVAQGDTFVVGAFRSNPDVAVYASAGRIVTLLSLPLFVMNGVVAPLIAELWTQGKKKQLETMLRGATSLASIPCLLGLLVFVLAGSRIMTIAYGKHYGRGGHVLAILAVGVFFGVAAGSCNFALIMTGHHRLVAIAAGITLVATIGGEIIGAHLDGMTGIAIASSGSTVLQNVLLTGMAKKRLGIWTQATFSPAKVRAFLTMRD
jgi:O-antigen/teichoic acid export membrane protein